MNREICKPKVISEYSSIGLSDQQVEGLLHIYEDAMEKMETAQAKRAWFDTGDFMRAKEDGVAGFELSIERREFLFSESEGHFWQGEFTQGNRRLDVMGHVLVDKG